MSLIDGVCYCLMSLFIVVGVYCVLFVLFVCRSLYVRCLVLLCVVVYCLVFFVVYCAFVCVVFVCCLLRLVGYVFVVGGYVLFAVCCLFFVL